MKKTIMACFIVLISFFGCETMPPKYDRSIEDFERVVHTGFKEELSYSKTLEWIYNKYPDVKITELGDVMVGKAIEFTLYFNVLSHTNYGSMNAIYDRSEDRFKIPVKVEIYMRIKSGNTDVKFVFSSIVDGNLRDEYAGFSNEFCYYYMKSFEQPETKIETTKITSLDGIDLFVPGNEPFLDGLINVSTITQLESEFENRPIRLQFEIDNSVYSRFVLWMNSSYRLVGTNDYEGLLFMDSQASQDYIIIVNWLSPGLNIYVMSYLYYCAMH